MCKITLRHRHLFLAINLRFEIEYFEKINWIQASQASSITTLFSTYEL